MNRGKPWEVAWGAASLLQMEEANPEDGIWLRSERCKGASPAELRRAFQAPRGVHADALNLEFGGRIQGMTGAVGEAVHAAQGGGWPGGPIT